MGMYIVQQLRLKPEIMKINCIFSTAILQQFMKTKPLNCDYFDNKGHLKCYTETIHEGRNPSNATTVMWPFNISPPWNITLHLFMLYLRQGFQFPKYYEEAHIKCTVCYKTFACNSNLKSHIATLHDKENLINYIDSVHSAKPL